MTPNNPSVIVMRGQSLRVNILKNNHLGGFNRWSLVHVRDINDKSRHHRNAFLFTCGDNSMTTCPIELRTRDCRFDDRNELYRPIIQIPTVVPDGVYVLGWAWYGGLTRNAFGGNFGDYYDCMYIEVRGGPITQVFYPVFKAGDSVTKEDGLCRSTVNRLGVCWRESCPGGGRPGTPMVPFELDGKTPAPLNPAHFTSPYKIPVRGVNDTYIISLSIRSVSDPSYVFATLRHRFSSTKFNMKRGAATVTCEVGGEVQKVVFYVNGVMTREDYDEPYSIGGDWRGGVPERVTYASWGIVDRRVHTVSCKAVGLSGYEAWKTVEVNTDT